MKKDLTTSDIHRRNILNNKYALEIIYDEISFPGVMFENKYRFTKNKSLVFLKLMKGRLIDI